MFPCMMQLMAREARWHHKLLFAFYMAMCNKTRAVGVFLPFFNAIGLRGFNRWVQL